MNHGYVGFAALQTAIGPHHLPACIPWETNCYCRTCGDGKWRRWPAVLLANIAWNERHGVGVADADDLDHLRAVERFQNAVLILQKWWHLTCPKTTWARFGFTWRDALAARFILRSWCRWKQRRHSPLVELPWSGRIVPRLAYPFARRSCWQFRRCLYHCTPCRESAVALIVYHYRKHRATRRWPYADPFAFRFRCRWDADTQIASRLYRRRLLFCQNPAYWKEEEARYLIREGGVCRNALGYDWHDWLAAAASAPPEEPAILEYWYAVATGLAKVY
jgi:hypothetical protein